MIFIDKLTELVFDERKKISSKFAAVFLSVLVILLLDNILGFSYSYLVDNKIDQVQKLNTIISDSTSDKTTVNYTVRLRKEVLERKNFFENSYEYLSALSFSQKKSDKTYNIKKPKSTKNSTPNNFWFHITSSGIYYLFGIIMIPLILVLDKKSDFTQKIVMTILLASTFVGIGLFFHWICSLIPMIANSWSINYIVNIIIQGFTIFLLFKYNDYSKNYY